MYICYIQTFFSQWGSSLGQFSFSSDAAVKHFARVFLRGEEEERGREEEQEESNAGRGRQKILVSFLAFVFFLKKK